MPNANCNLRIDEIKDSDMHPLNDRFKKWIVGLETIIHDTIFFQRVLKLFDILKYIMLMKGLVKSNDLKRSVNVGL